MTDIGEWQTMEWQTIRITFIGEWHIMGNDRHCEWQAMKNDRQWWTTDTGKWLTLGNGRQLGNDRQWWMTDNGKWLTLGNDRQLMNDRQWWMTDNGKWQTLGNDRQLGIHTWSIHNSIVLWIVS